ncbi:trypsin-like serine protease [Streptomyces sp. DK15]|uniref:trypsin-like serine protease n=1 Tax=Streptomyces sp. DK15 TaxID=2957499 RepID=UPI0029C0A753|nr:trypsin-like serine protease [Streptomyces sp. DK15]
MPTPDEAWDRALEVQDRLITAGNLKAVSLPDLIIAATAERHGATVLHYDGDYDVIAAVTGGPMRWVVPAGTADRPSRGTVPASAAGTRHPATPDLAPRVAREACFARAKRGGAGIVAVDKRTVVTAVLCALAALGASAAVAELAPPPEATTSARAKTAAPSGAPSGTPTGSSRSQAPKPLLSGELPPPVNPQPGGPAAYTGALFTGGLDGQHFCTATVVRSPGKNLIVTAGHCLLAGKQRDSAGGAVFAPAYANGVAPYGTWKIEEVFEDDRWAEETDDDYDLAFARLAPDDKGRPIEDVTGAAALDTSGRAGEEVTVTGYPSDRKVPRTCTSTSVRLSPTEQRFDCADFPGGTSGSAWISRDSRIIGILTGGDTDDVSTSTILGDYAAQLYAKATTGR